ncbi:hypothetical protein [Macrococcus brunensis]|uniref:hypothetical protein n=1 Tax=Macrococcus brunensis TaxID=198483 RepID=UPI001EEFFA40|nr:hypothetical protein [Macrococcus brunensis]ULG71352.1 hypothetical protein MGG12_08385 [Macrococcus brunensis]ULG73658.1 hypothetical protein MGG13_08105 [Macrococcus brunensis]
MKLKSIIAGTTLLLIAGYFFSLRYQLKNPDKVLTEIKKQYSDIEGAYIDYTPENYKKLGLETTIYRGGIITAAKEYDFIADAYSGELIDTTEITTV